MIIHVEDFMKITQASIDISNFSIFVGKNNSGKSYLMQLIYGVIDTLTNLNDTLLLEMDEVDSLFAEFPVLFNDFTDIENSVNRFLDRKKESIVRSIFKTDLKIGKLAIEIGKIEKEYLVIQDDKDEVIMANSAVPPIPDAKYYSMYCENERLLGLRTISKTPGRTLLKLIFSDIVFGSTLYPEQSVLYLPASRSGLMLLYNHFFEKIAQQDEIDDANGENEFGLTAPVYNYLRFLQTYKPSPSSTALNQNIIKFINTNLIKGTIKKSGSTMLYTPKNTDASIPAYLSSSMINEISPVVQLLTGNSRYRFILYDEIETCQHPLTQIEMARLLVRMVNSGYKMIVSTHSDTMAVAVNNLIMLSFTENRIKKAADLNYSSDDFFRSDNIHAYQFVELSDGRIEVVELENCLANGFGFDFTLFNEANEKIFHAADVILGDN